MKQNRDQEVDYELGLQKNKTYIKFFSFSFNFFFGVDATPKINHILSTHKPTLLKKKCVIVVAKRNN